MDAIKKWFAEDTTKAGLAALLGVAAYWLTTGQLQTETLVSAFWLLVLRGRGQTLLGRSGTATKCLLPFALLIAVGCAQNQVPRPVMRQDNSGPETPQTTTQSNAPRWEIHDIYVSPPSGKDDGTVGGSAHSGLAKAAGGMFIWVLPNWQDASASAKQRSGDMSPTTGSQSANAQGELSPRTQVDPSLALGMPGSAVTSSASGTAGFDGSPVSGAPNTVSPTQTPTYTNIRVPQGQLQQLQSLFQQIFGKALGLPTPAPAQPAPTPETIPAP